MGVRNRMALFSFPLLLLWSVVAGPYLADSKVTLESQPWPDAEPCEVCVPVQFGKLQMRLPLSDVGQIVVGDSGDPVLHILPRTGGLKESVAFLAVQSERLLGEYRRSGLLQGTQVSTNEQFFDALGKLPASSAMTKIRSIEGLDTARRYSKSSRGRVHVYWIQSSLPGGSQKVYFVIDGQDAVYLLAGDVTQEFYKAALSNLRISDLP